MAEQKRRPNSRMGPRLKDRTRKTGIRPKQSVGDGRTLGQRSRDAAAIRRQRREAQRGSRAIRGQGKFTGENIPGGTFTTVQRTRAKWK